MKLFDDLQTIIHEYSGLLDPPPGTLKGSFKNQGYAFRIRLTNIIGLFAKGRTKIIFLEKSIPNVGSSEIIADMIYTEMGFPELLNQLDRSIFHFCQVSGSCYVNLKYYNLTNDQVVTDKISNRSFNKYSAVKISKQHKAEFMSRKTAYHHISSLQKEQLHYILNFIINGLNSFTER